MREWYVHGIPKVGYFPLEATVDPLCGVANKVVTGPFTDVLTAAHYVANNRPMQLWKAVSIQSRYNSKPV